MNAPRFVRGTKSRLFLYLGAVSFVGLVVYMYHGAQLQLDEVRTVSEKCQQQQESLSAQLQVIFEYKLRLEKSLQQEKNEHRQTKEELLSKAKEEQTFHEKEKLEAINKYTSIQQQYKLLQSQHDDLDEECNKVRISQLQGLEEKSKLEMQIQAVQQELEQVQAAKDKDLESLKSSYMQLEIENEQISKQYKAILNQRHESTDKINYLEKQNKQLQRELSDAKRDLNSCRRLDGKVDSPVNVRGESSKETRLVVEKPSEGNKATKSTAAANQPQANPAVLPEPVVEGNSKDKSSTNLTTPQINPDAINSQDKSAAAAQQVAINNVVPMPPPRRYPGQDHPYQHLPVNPRANVIPPPMVQPRQHDGGNGLPHHPGMFDWRKQELPAGVVPAPNHFAFNHLKNSQEVAEHDNAANEVDNAAMDHNAWDSWNLKKPQPHFANQNAVLQNPNNAHIEEPANALRFQYLNHNAENLVRDLQQREKFLADLQQNKHMVEDNREIPRNMNNNYPYNGDYEKDGQRNDLQLEEGEEEGDDDVDQIDYANDGSKQKAVHHKKLPVHMEKHEHHDSVMVNPK